MDPSSTHDDPRAPLEALLGRRFADWAEAEAGTVAGSLPAAIVLAAAACLAVGAANGLDPGGRRGPPRIVLPASHQLRFEAPLAQLLRLAGGRASAAGTVEACTPAELAAALPRAAAAVYVVHDRPGLPQGIDLPSFVAGAHGQSLPAMVIDAASGNWRGWLDAGADLVVLDTARALGGPQAGIILGRRVLIEACDAQRQGLGAILRPALESLAALERLALPPMPDGPPPPGTSFVA